LPLSDVVQWGYSYLRRNYPHLLLPNTNNLNFVSYIETICNKYKFFKSNLEMDSERGINFLYNSWINNLKVNYEKEN
jgi:hypothetical protein